MTSSGLNSGWTGGSWTGGGWTGGTWLGVTVGGQKIDIDIAFDGSLLKGRDRNTWRVFSGKDFIGASLQATHNLSGMNQEVFTFRVDDVYLDTTASNDVWRYRVSYRSDKNLTWKTMCSDFSGGPTDLIPLAGMYWDFVTGGRRDDPSSFTIACNDGALEECAHVGYRPWANGMFCTGSGAQKRCSQVSLKDHHQACTRMMRADYCGDGGTWTLDGTNIDLYDYLAPPIQLQTQNWSMEARWVAAGAL